MFEIVILNAALVMGQTSAPYAAPVPRREPLPAPAVRIVPGTPPAGAPVLRMIPPSYGSSRPTIAPRFIPSSPANGSGPANGAPVEVIVPGGNGHHPDGCPCAPPCEGCAEEKKDCGWCKLGEPLDLSTAICGKDSPYDFGGWVQGGYHTRSDGYFNDQPDRINLHQFWLYGERKADGKDGLDWGFRFDFIYGIDAVNTQAFGGPAGSWDFMNGWGDGVREAWALPQLYGEAAVGDLAVKFGKFYTHHGFEVVPATGNFFYSHNFTFNFSEPFTHSGAFATYKATDKLETGFGWSAGIDTGFDRFRGGSSFLGLLRYAVTDTLTASYMTTVGDLGFVGNGIFNTFLLDWKPSDQWQYVAQSDIVKHDGVTLTSFNSVGLVNYLFYSVNDCLKLGCRGEWYKVNGVSFYEVTGGVNLIPQANVRIRPEYRYQWSPAGESGNNPLGVPVDEHIFGIDAIITF